MPLPRNTTLSAQGLPVGMQLRAGLEISPRDAQIKLADGSLLLIDCRTQEEWETVHVAGSVLIPLHELEQRADEVSQQLADQPQVNAVALLCHHGVRSLKGALALRQLGFSQALSIAGGIDLWSLSVDPSLPQYDRDAGGCRIKGS